MWKLLVLASFVFPGSLMALPQGDRAKPDRPNVVLIVSDDQAFGDFGFMGHEVIQTPRLDRLAAQSAVFTRGYVPTALCRPSLATLVTGLYPHVHGVTGNDPRPGVDRRRIVDRFARSKHLMELLGERGYRSLQTGKWWEANPKEFGFTEGMTHGDPKRGGRHGDKGLAIGRKTMKPIFDFIDAGGDQPFFLWYAPFLPHSPHNPPKRLLDKYQKPGRSKFVARYYAMCEWFDETCGQLLDHLDKRGLSDNTLVVFVVDNGWIQKPNSGGFAKRSKRSPNEGGVRTPIMVRWPGRVKPGFRDPPVSSIDIMPTILTACGIEVPRELPGTDLIAVAQGRKPAPDAVFGEAFTHDIVDLSDPRKSLLWRWVVSGRWKLLVPARGTARPELYDVVADPHETNNVVATEPDVAARLGKQLESWWPVARKSTPPNIVLLVTDDQRNDMLGCAGHPILRTPAIDSLAAEGTRFTNAFVTTSICAASRASILTGLHRSTHGYTFRTGPLARRYWEQSYPRLLRSAGWRTGFVGKLGVNMPKAGPRRMFDFFRPKSPPYLKRRKQGEPRHLTELTADDAIAFLRSTTRDQPFCLSVSFNAPHAEDSNPAQYIWPKAVDGMYADADIAAPPLADAEFFQKQPAFLRESLGRVRWRWRFDTPEKRTAMTRGYYRMITGVDGAVGRILAELDKLDLTRNTVVIFTSDNGYFLGERGFAGKWLMYEPSIRVPLVIRDPRSPVDARGRLDERMVLNIDIPETILDIAEVPIPSRMQGRSLVVRSGDPAWRTDFFYEHLFEHPRIPKSIGVRGRRWKYVRYFEQQPVYEELYDLENDPLETEKGVHDPKAAGVLERLRKRCDELRDRYAAAH